MQFKTRTFTVDQAAAGDGLELSPSNLGFNPSHEFRRAQISTNDFGGGAGTFKVLIRPVGSSQFYDFIHQEGENATGGEDIVICGRDEDPLFDALKLTFANATGDIRVDIGFIDPDGK